MTANSAYIFFTGILIGVASAFLLIDSNSVNTKIEFEPKDHSINIVHINQKGTVISKSKVNYLPEDYSITIDGKDYRVMPLALSKKTIIEFKEGKLHKKEEVSPNK